MNLKEKKLRNGQPSKHSEKLLQISPWTFKTYLIVSSASDGAADAVQIRESAEQMCRMSERRYVGR